MRDSNSHSEELDPKSSVSTNSTNGAILERRKGIEPLALAWKAKVLPLYDRRIDFLFIWWSGGHLKSHIPPYEGGSTSS